MLRRLGLCLLVLVFMPLCLEAQVTKTEHFDFPPGGVLRLNNSVGEVTIQGSDRTDLEITTVKSRHTYASEETQTAGLDDITVTTQRLGNELVVTTEFPRYAVFPPPVPFKGAKHFNLEYRINVPRTASIVVDHNTGEVHIDNVSGDVHVKVFKGAVTLRLPEENRYAIDAKSDAGGIVSDFPGRWHQTFWLLGARYRQNTPANTRNLYIRTGFGDIAILKIRKPPYTVAAGLPINQ